MAVARAVTWVREEARSAWCLLTLTSFAIAMAEYPRSTCFRRPFATVSRKASSCAAGDSVARAWSMPGNSSGGTHASHRRLQVLYMTLSKSTSTECRSAEAAIGSSRTTENCVDAESNAQRLAIGDVIPVLLGAAPAAPQSMLNVSMVMLTRK